MKTVLAISSVLIVLFVAGCANTFVKPDLDNPNAAMRALDRAG